MVSKVFMQQKQQQTAVISLGVGFDPWLNWKIKICTVYNSFVLNFLMAIDITKKIVSKLDSNVRGIL